MIWNIFRTYRWRPLDPPLVGRISLYPIVRGVGMRHKPFERGGTLVTHITSLMILAVNSTNFVMNISHHTISFTQNLITTCSSNKAELFIYECIVLTIVRNSSCKIITFILLTLKKNLLEQKISQFNSLLNLLYAFTYNISTIFYSQA